MRQDLVEKMKRDWQGKHMHGRFYASLHQDNADIMTSNMCLTSVYLFPVTERSLFAISLRDKIIWVKVFIK